MKPQTYQGTWEEITAHGAELAGKTVQVIVLDERSTSTLSNEGMTSEEIEHRPQALDAYFQTTSSFPQTPVLSERDISRESIYGQR